MSNGGFSAFGFYEAFYLGDDVAFSDLGFEVVIYSRVVLTTFVASRVES